MRPEILLVPQNDGVLDKLLATMLLERSSLTWTSKVLNMVDYSDIERFDLFFCQSVARVSEQTRHNIIHEVHPDLTVNGRETATKKSSVLEAAAEVFNSETLVYRKDISEKKWKVIKKPEWQTTGPYEVKDEAVFSGGRGFINQKFLGNGTDLDSIFFFEDEILFGYRYSIDPNASTGFVTVASSTPEFPGKVDFQYSETVKRSIPEWKKMIQVAQKCGIQFGKIEFLEDENGNKKIIDIGSKPMIYRQMASEKMINLVEGEEGPAFVEDLLCKSAEIFERILVQKWNRVKDHVVINGSTKINPQNEPEISPDPFGS